MKKLIFALTIILFISAVGYSQDRAYSRTIAIAPGDSVTQSFNGIYADLVFYSASDSITVKTNIDTTFQTTRVIKYSDGNQAVADLLGSGTHELVDPVIRSVRFINFNALDTAWIETKLRREF